MEDATAVFWKSFVKHPRQTGAIVPSSRQLAQAMLARTDLSRARFVIELGRVRAHLPRRLWRLYRPAPIFSPSNVTQNS